MLYAKSIRVLAFFISWQLLFEIHFTDENSFVKYFIHSYYLDKLICFNTKTNCFVLVLRCCLVSIVNKRLKILNKLIDDYLSMRGFYLSLREIIVSFHLISKNLCVFHGN